MREKRGSKAYRIEIKKRKRERDHGIESRMRKEENKKIWRERESRINHVSVERKEKKEE